jgi:hypothetical protein
MNERAMLTQNPEAINTVFNTAVGDRTTLNELLAYLKEFLSNFSLHPPVNTIHCERFEEFLLLSPAGVQD